MSLVPPLNRRSFLSALASTLAGSMTVRSANPTRSPKRVLRLAHLTDVHIQPERRAAQGFAQCLTHVQSQPDRPDLILFGGDCIMDSFGQGKDRTRTQWDLWQRVLKSECSLPFHSCIGNHDVWGWGKSSGVSPTETAYGKAWAIDELRLPKRYYAFTRAGWKFIVLDSTHPSENRHGYVGRIDDEQFDWLQTELDKIPREQPVLVLSHIPILAACVFLDGNNEKSGDWVVPGSWMHLDTRRLTALFHKSGRVKACLSGHSHMVDEVSYLGTTYYCNGAVCGNWWNGKYHQFAEGYALIDLYDDGSTSREFVVYGWNASQP
jgi:3',5'-cyclic AMP phosphodiesterase CpdA